MLSPQSGYSAQKLTRHTSVSDAIGNQGMDKVRDKNFEYISYRIDKLAHEIAPRMTRILNDNGFDQLLVEKNQIIDELRLALSLQPGAAKEKKLEEKVRGLEAALRNEKEKSQVLARRIHTLEQSMESYWNSLKRDSSALEDQISAEMEEKWHKLNQEQQVQLYRTDAPCVLESLDFASWQEREAHLARTATWIVPNPESGQMETASIITETASHSVHGLKTRVGDLSAGKYSCQVMVRDLGGRDLGLWVRDADGDAIFEVFYDLQREQVRRTRTIEGFAEDSSHLLTIFGGWKLCSATFFVEKDMKANVHLNIRNPASTSSSYAGDGQSGIGIWGFRLQKAAEA